MQLHRLNFALSSSVPLFDPLREWSSWPFLIELFPGIKASLKYLDLFFDGVESGLLESIILIWLHLVDKIYIILDINSMGWPVSMIWLWLSKDDHHHLKSLKPLDWWVFIVSFQLPPVFLFRFNFLSSIKIPIKGFDCPSKLLLEKIKFLLTLLLVCFWVEWFFFDFLFKFFSCGFHVFW